MKIEYKIINNTNLGEFNETINKYLQDGWILYGTPFIRGDLAYCQALTKTTQPQRPAGYQPL